MERMMSYDEFLKKVKVGIVTESGNCPVTPGLTLFQGKWTDQVLYVLCIYDTIRFGELKREFPGITNTMLTATLKDLEANGIVHREQYNEIPPRVEYSFTEKGRDLFPIFYAMMNWGYKYEKDFYKEKPEE